MLHATPIGNTVSILKRGILAAKSKGTRKSVWCCAPGKRTWAVLHVVNRHKPKGVCVITIEVPRSWLRKGEKPGLWHTGGKDIPREWIKAMEFFT